MMRPVRTRAIAFLLPVIAACAHQADRSGTLATLHQVRPDTQEVAVDQGLDRAVQSYGEFLKQAPDSALAPEAMRRLADLKIEKEFGIQGDGKLVELPASQSGAAAKSAAPPSVPVPVEPVGSPTRQRAAALRAPAVTKIDARSATRSRTEAAVSGPSAASERDLEQRAASQSEIPANTTAPLAVPGGMDGDPARAGPLEAIKLYDQLLAKYPQYALRDQVLYQKARAYEELGQTDEAMAVMEQLVSENPRSRFSDEVQFRRAERFFIARKYREAESAYTAI